jgi:hypothetical protein
METETIAARVAENEDAFRRANERIETAAEGIRFGLIPFICECPDRGCTSLARLKAHEYERVRASGNRFLVVPGHEVISVDGVTIARVGQKFDRYSMMEKVGEAGERAKELDPRAVHGTDPTAASSKQSPV